MMFRRSCNAPIAYFPPGIGQTVILDAIGDSNFEVMTRRCRINPSHYDVGILKLAAVVDSGCDFRFESPTIDDSINVAMGK